MKNEEKRVWRKNEYEKHLFKLKKLVRELKERTGANYYAITYDVRLADEWISENAEASFDEL